MRGEEKEGGGGVRRERKSEFVRKIAVHVFARAEKSEPSLIFPHPMTDY